MGCSMVSEVEKYQTCYREPNYRLQGARLARVRQDIESMLPGSTYLDVGCGRGEMVRLAIERGVKAQGLELVPELGSEIVQIGSITALPFVDGWFDYVSCYDVIEHLPTEQVPIALDELWRVCGGVLFLTTNDKRSHLGDLELHLTRKPRSWWDEQFRSRAHSLIDPSTYGRDEWHWRIAMAER
jgi:2-polyprenyl-3-methyl-5-hydroxy-6-metoxy-1,4-benzoquinol methylase